MRGAADGPRTLLPGSKMRLRVIGTHARENLSLLWYLGARQALTQSRRSAGAFGGRELCGVLCALARVRAAGWRAVVTVQAG